MNKRGFGFLTMGLLFVLMMVVIILAMGQNGIDTSTINKSIETLEWEPIGQNISKSLQILAHDKPNWLQVIINMIDKAIEFMGYSIFAIAKLAMQLAADNPDIINFKVLLLLVLLFLVAPLIYPTFLILVCLVLFINEFIQNRREKRKMKELVNARRLTK